MSVAVCDQSICLVSNTALSHILHLN